MIASINKVMQRHLAQLHQEISAYDNEGDLWLVPGEIANSAGNLCLHLCGNLQHYIGAVLGHSGYQRQREQEFSAQNVPAATLLEVIDKTKTVVETTLGQLGDAHLTEEYPEQVFGEPMTTEFFLVHLTGHLAYHLGQINYHRRLLAGQG